MENLLNKPPKILFLGGPSGSGKSHFADKYLSAKHGWFHLEIDQHPKDGIDVNNLRPEWKRFYERFEPGALHKELSQRAGSLSRVVLSHPGNQVFDPQHLESGVGYFHFAYLYGHPARCLKAFLAREQVSGRGLKADHWDHNNHLTFDRLSRSHNHRLLIEAFDADGERRDLDEIYVDLLRVIGGS
jgi:hypothetical protein